MLFASNIYIVLRVLNLRRCKQSLIVYRRSFKIDVTVVCAVDLSTHTIICRICLVMWLD